MFILYRFRCPIPGGVELHPLLHRPPSSEPSSSLIPLKRKGAWGSNPDPLAYRDIIYYSYKADSAEMLTITPAPRIWTTIGFLSYDLIAISALVFLWMGWDLVPLKVVWLLIVYYEHAFFNGRDTNSKLTQREVTYILTTHGLWLPWISKLKPVRVAREGKTVIWSTNDIKLHPAARVSSEDIYIWSH
jgi:hypothetical protein